MAWVISLQNAYIYLIAIISILSLLHSDQMVLSYRNHIFSSKYIFRFSQHAKISALGSYFMGPKETIYGCRHTSLYASETGVSGQGNIQQQNRTILTKREADRVDEIMGKPFLIPSGTFKPKQSLGQNFLTDQNYVRKIVDSLHDDSEKGCRVIEIGPGLGALTRLLYPKYPQMRAIEIDQRAIAFLNEKMPSLQVVHMNALDADWAQLAADRNGKLSVIGNLPYYVVSQILFSLVDNYKAIKTGVFTMQLEVAERLTAQPGCKDYGIPSVVFQLYTKPTMNFKIPPKVFYPVPKVDSALVTLDFTSPHPDLNRVELRHFRRVVTMAFNQRRKMLRQSLKDITSGRNITLSEIWATKRPDQLRPLDFIQLTVDIYGEKKKSAPAARESIDQLNGKSFTRDDFASEIAWRRSVHVRDDIVDQVLDDNNVISTKLNK